MAANEIPSFAALLRRYGIEPLPDTRPDERERLIDYLNEHGAHVSTADDVYQAILTLDHEEELSAFRCREGVAVSHASDGWRLLLKSGDSIPAPQERSVGASGC